MVTNAAAKYLWDVQRAAERIVRSTAGRSFDDYLAGEMLSAAVECQFEIIGEALVCLRRIAPEAAATIPQLLQIIEFRNVLIRACGDFDSTEVWGNIRNGLPRLRNAVAEWLRSAPGP